MERVPAHDDCAVGEVAEHAAGVFARDTRPAAAADRVASSKGFGTVSLTEISKVPVLRSNCLITQVSSSPGWYCSRRSGIAA